MLRMKREHNRYNSSKAIVSLLSPSPGFPVREKTQNDLIWQNGSREIRDDEHRDKMSECQAPPHVQS